MQLDLEVCGDATVTVVDSAYLTPTRLDGR